MNPIHEHEDMALTNGFETLVHVVADTPDKELIGYLIDKTRCLEDGVPLGFEDCPEMGHVVLDQLIKREVGRRSGVN